MEKPLLSVEELLQIESERELRAVVVVKCCSRCEYASKCFRRDYCDKIYRLYRYYLKNGEKSRKNGKWKRKKKGLRKRKKVIHSVLVDLINIELHFG